MNGDIFDIIIGATCVLSSAIVVSNIRLKIILSWRWRGPRKLGVCSILKERKQMEKTNAKNEFQLKAENGRKKTKRKLTQRK